MAASPREKSGPARIPEHRLDSWKAIATYLNRDVTTVQRWEKREGMPVHRHLHNRLGSVYAFSAELDEWAQKRNLGPAGNGDAPCGVDPAQEPSPPATSSLSRRDLVLALAGAGAAAAGGAGLWLQKKDFFWRNPIPRETQTITDLEELDQPSAVSRDGRFVAFVSARDGQQDVWLTQVGSGEFHNITRGSAPELVNPSVRTLGFSPDGSLVTFWVRKPAGASGQISVWAAPILGGEPRLYLEGAAEFDWSQDGTRLVYHTTGPGDPLFVSDGSPRPGAKPIFTASAGLHSHFPLWSPDGAFIYFVQGSLPDKLDIWRLAPEGGAPERITSHAAQVSHPVLLDRRTLLYLATDSDHSGPWLYGVDIERRVPHRLTSFPDRYTSLAASADGQRLVATRANSTRTLWRLQISDSPAENVSPVRISLTTRAGFSPRLGPDYLLYVSDSAAGESIWKMADGISTELWSAPEARVLGGPAMTPDGQSIAFSVLQHGRKLLYVMRADGTNVRMIADSLDLQGAPAWGADGRSITVAATERGTPHLFDVSLDGRSPKLFLQEYSLDPVWSPDGSFVLYTGPDIGTTFSVRAASPQGILRTLSNFNLTRGARHLKFIAGGKGLLVLRGEIRHKDLWFIDLATGTERQLTNLPFDFDVQNFDATPDGREVVLERVQNHSDVVLINLRRR
ncbi:MAG TPA: hypothetical protein VKX49_17320 [Bryobacteraceae bacterium]|nr:hypothetical protein [Bryobacteraceae bacterium]